MLINQKTDTQLNEGNSFLDGVICINSSQWLSAYFIFKQLTDGAMNPSVAKLYNMGLCYFAAKEHQQAISVLNDAIKNTATPPSLTAQALRMPDHLLAQEYQSNSYRLALTEAMLTLHASLVKLRIRRLLLDANLELGNWEEVIRLSSLPEMDKCKNVMDAVLIAKTKINQ